MSASNLGFTKGVAVVGTSANVPLLLSAVFQFGATINVQDTREVIFWITYTQGDATSQMEFFLQASKDGTNFFDMTLDNLGIVTVDTVAPDQGFKTSVDRAIKQWPARNFTMVYGYTVGENILAVRLAVREFAGGGAPFASLFVEATQSSKGIE